MATIEEYAATVTEEERKSNTKKSIFKVLTNASKKINFKDYLASHGGMKNVQYLSWANVYKILAYTFDEVEYGIEEASDGSLIKEVGNSAMIKVFLIINSVKYTYHYPVVTNTHATLPMRPFGSESVGGANNYVNAKQVEFAQQRGFAKAAALAGLALDLYSKDGLEFEPDAPVKIASSVIKAEAAAPKEDDLLASFVARNLSNTPAPSGDRLTTQYLLLKKQSGIKKPKEWVDAFNEFLSIEGNSANKKKVEFFTQQIEELKKEA